MKEKITIDDIDRLSELSKLKFTHEEKEKLVTEVTGIIEMLNQIDQVKIDSQVEIQTQKINQLREDEPKEDMSSNEVFLNSNNCGNGYFVVPRVVE